MRTTRLAQQVIWEASGDPQAPFVATVDGERWQVRVVAGRYALAVNDVVVEPVGSWPAAWTRPAPKPREDDPSQQRELELEDEKYQRSLGVKPSKLV